MILIADSGSTKTDWALITNDQSVIRFSSAGMNPNTTAEQELLHTLSAQTFLMRHLQDVNTVYFYGAGCTGTENIRRMETVLGSFYTHAIIQVQSDMTGAVYAVRTGHEPCIIGILGTGANSCFFDGVQINGLDFSLGYILGDEGSGTWIGKRLLRDYFYGVMPEHLREAFEQKFPLERAVVLQAVYRSAAPAAYLGSLAPFAWEHVDDAYIQALLQEGVISYIDINIRRFSVQPNTAVHMIGSIAYRLQDKIIEYLSANGLRAGKFLQTPMEGLIAWHMREEV